MDWAAYSEGNTSDDFVQVPEVNCPLSEDEFELLLQSIDPLSPSDSYGIDLYQATRDFVNSRI